MQSTSEAARCSWTRHAMRVARKINFGWWLEMVSTPLVTAGLVGAFTLLLLRRQLPETPSWIFGASGGAMVALIAAIAWLRARKRFETPEQSMVRIEAAMHLRNALSAARAGVTPWPSVPPKVDVGLDWRWQRVIIPPLAALGFLAAGILIPVATGAAQGQALEEPLAWGKIEADLQRLSQEEVIDESHLEETKRQLEELRKQKEEEWFSHSSLEATDALKKQHQSDIRQLQRELERTDRALDALTKAGGLSQAEKDRLLLQFEQALQGLQNGGLKPNPQLLDQLRNLDPNQLGQLDPEQLRQLRENLRKGANACKECESEGAGDDWLDELLDGDGSGDGEGGGRGGISRGPGHAPGVLGQEGEKLETGEIKGVESRDLSRTLPGDLLQLEDGEHEVDRAPSSPTAGGGIGSTGEGGDRVWRESLDPAEQKALRRFFE